MGGLFGKSEPKPAVNTPTKPVNKQVKVTEHELILAKLKLFEDKIEARIRKLDKQDAEVDKKIKAAVAAKKKEEAYFLLKQRKTINDTKKSTALRLETLQTQIGAIETTIEEVQFTETIKQGNRAIESLSQQIDLEEIRLAKELQEEGRMRRQEIDQMLSEDGDGQDLLDELNQIESQMLAENFEKQQVPATKEHVITEQRQKETRREEPAAMLN